MLDMLKLRQDLSESGILMSFNGPFTHGIIEEFGNAIKRYLEVAQLDKGAVMDVFATYIEQAQNAKNYLARSAFSDDRLAAAIVVIAFADGAYSVSSGNAIRRADAGELRERLRTINALDKDGLKKLYKERLRMERRPDSAGAGVGLISLARSSVGGLQYSFDPFDEDHDFFSLTVRVSGGQPC